MTTEKTLATVKQIQIIYYLSKKRGVTDYVPNLVCDFTKGRTNLTCGMFYEEAEILINDLETWEPSLGYEWKEDPHTKTEKARADLGKEIYRAAKEYGLIYGETEEDVQINAHIINKFFLDLGFKNPSGGSVTQLKKMLKTLRNIIATEKVYKPVINN